MPRGRILLTCGTFLQLGHPYPLCRAQASWARPANESVSYSLKLAVLVHPYPFRGDSVCPFTALLELVLPVRVVRHRDVPGHSRLVALSSQSLVTPIINHPSPETPLLPSGLKPFGFRPLRAAPKGGRRYLLPRET